MSQVKMWLWMALAVIIGVQFFNAAIQKLMGVPAALAPFDEIGWPLWTAWLTSIGEILGAIALIVPVTRALGGLLLSAIMVGAAIVNIANGHPGYIWLNAVLIAGSLLLTWQAREHLWHLTVRLRRSLRRDERPQDQG